LKRLINRFGAATHPETTASARPQNASFLRAAIAAALFPTAITLLALIPARVPQTSVALAYVLAVAASAVVGGSWAGWAASLLSFLALNFFFTPPLGTLSVEKSQDLVALGVYFVVSSLVAVLLSRTVSQRARAERREQETLLLNRVGYGLLRGDSIEEVLSRFATSLVDLLDLARCEIVTDVTAPVVVQRDAADLSRQSEVIPMVAQREELGRVVLTARASRSAPNESELDVVRAFASQTALALSGIHLASEANEARMEAEGNRLRAALFSSITHDLRTPLASITASVTSLLDADVRFTHDDRRKLLETIHHEAERLNRLVGNFLELSRMRAGAMIANRTPAAMEEVIEGVLQRLHPILRNHEIRVMIRDGLPEVPIDVVQIDQLLTNVLENAAKFSSAGSEISISATTWHDAVRVRIADQGKGIPASERLSVFEPFTRTDPQDGTGSGLGLSIAQAIVTSHKGKIWIEGAPGGGTAVIFELPRQQSDAP
jgi:two-component system, OmpR family, sensor histidine kinase KdpD